MKGKRGKGWADEGEELPEAEPRPVSIPPLSQLERSEREAEHQRVRRMAAFQAKIAALEQRMAATESQLAKCKQSHEEMNRLKRYLQTWLGDVEKP